MKRPTVFRILLAFNLLFTAGVGSQRVLGDTSAPARVSYIDGSAAYEPAGDVDWSEVVINLPLLSGDRIFTHPGSRVEIELAFANRLRLNQETEVLFMDVSGHEPVLKVELGDLIVRVNDARKHHIQTPFATVLIEERGLYRIGVGDRGVTRLTVRKGRAQVESGQQLRRLDAGQTLTIGEGSTDLTQVANDYQEDRFDRWSARRDAIFVGRRPSSRYVHGSVAGSDDLDRYGNWEHLGGYGPVWFPRVAVGWIPYRSGRWIFYPFYGWTWLSYEPWGWAPYHYGDWVYYAPYNRWCWVPGGPGIRLWGGAHVNFYFGGGYIGWRPRPYRRGGYRGRYRPRGRPGGGHSGRGERRRGNLRGLTAVALNDFRSGRSELYRTEPERLRARFKPGLPDRFRNPLGGSVGSVVSALPKPMTVRSPAAGLAIRSEGKNPLRSDPLPPTAKSVFGGRTGQGAATPVTPPRGGKVTLEAKPSGSGSAPSAPRNPAVAPAVNPDAMRRPGSAGGVAIPEGPRPASGNGRQSGSSKILRVAPTPRVGSGQVRRQPRRDGGVTSRTRTPRISPGRAGKVKVRRTPPTPRVVRGKVQPRRTPSGVTAPRVRAAPRLKARPRSSVNRRATPTRRPAPSRVKSRRSRPGSVAPSPKIRSRPRISAPVKRTAPSFRKQRVSRPNRRPGGQLF